MLSDNLTVFPSPVSDYQVRELPTDAPENPWVMTPDEIMRRRDVRETHLIYSIDPLGCEDVDDALCARPLPNGNVELSVHIADVSYFVQVCVAGLSYQFVNA